MTEKEKDLLKALVFKIRVGLWEATDIRNSDDAINVVDRLTQDLYD